ncbi:MAG: hypothetical protein ABII00_19305 [Elusimicrobiota bacterium]
MRDSHATDARGKSTPGARPRMSACLCALAIGLAVPAPARAADSASLQFTLPAPDPVHAGDTVALQALVVNTGAQAWAAGSYYWVAYVYEIEEKLVGRTDQVSPRDSVAPGGVASISLPFRVPATMVGRRLYRVLLIKDGQTLVDSDFKPFQILAKPIPEPPKPVDYRVEGNVTVSYKNASGDAWSEHSGATTFNTVGKIKDSSYLFNAYILHEPGDVFDPFILLFTYYAPWGTVYGGDISPTLSELSLNGQGMRGVWLEQKKGPWEWSVLGGQTIESQPGTQTANGRFARTLYAAECARSLPANVKLSVNYFLSADESGSLNTDPDSANFRGPTLVPQKNGGYGLGLSWDPRPRMKVLVDYQLNTYYADTSQPGVKDTAYKGEFRWERKIFKLRTYLQRAGSDFVAFGSPAVVGDRMTYNGSLGLFPASWYTLSLSLNQYIDNLDNDPAKVTTTQRYIATSHAFQLPAATSLSLSLSLNTAKGKPATALDNQTTTAGFGVAHSFGRQSVSLSVQNSRFTDNNKLADDLDTNTVALSSNFFLPRAVNASFGITRSQTKDKADGSTRTSLTVSPSLAKRLSADWTIQFWATLTKSENTSPAFPADRQDTALNSEFTWAQSQRSSLTLGLGYNKIQDKIQTSQDASELTVATRYSYSF